MGNYDWSIIRLQVNGVMIAGFAGFTDLQLGEDASFNDPGDGTAIGFNDVSRANKMRATIAVNQTAAGDGNLLHLKRLALTSAPITALAFIPEEDQGVIRDGQLVEVQISEGRINDGAGPFKDGTEAGDHTFNLLCSRGSLSAKGGETITITPPTQTGAELG